MSLNTRALSGTNYVLTRNSWSLVEVIYHISQGKMSADAIQRCSYALRGGVDDNVRSH